MTADNLTALADPMSVGVASVTYDDALGRLYTVHDMRAYAAALLAARDAEASFVGWWREDAMTAYTPGDNIGEFLVAGWKPVGIISPEQMSAALQADTARAEGVSDACP